MRNFVVLALATLSSPVFAADLGGGAGAGGYVRGYAGVPSGPLTIYDFEPGTYVRAYFLPPWRGRHYFPTNGHAPLIGRDENLEIDGELPPLAETYQRSWSNSGPLLPTPELPVPQK